MSVVKIKTGELEGVIFEIFGFADPETKEVKIHGLVREELPSEITKLQLKRLGKKLQEELKTFQESLKELWETYGEKETNEEGQEVYKVPAEKAEEFKAKMAELINVELEINTVDFKEADFDFKSKTPDYTYFLLDLLFPA